MTENELIERPDRLRLPGGARRIYGGPRWVRPDGEHWVSISEAVSVEEVAVGYGLRYKDGWIELLPDAPSRTSLREATKWVIAGEGTHFGPILDATKAPDSLVWHVTASSNVKREEDAWILGEPDGVALGLHLQHWRAKLGDCCVVEGDRITLDLTEAKKTGGEINLDPAVITAQTGYIHSEHAVWATCRNGASLYFNAGIHMYANAVESTVYKINRAFYQFDTSGLARVCAGSFYVTPDVISADGPGTGLRVHTITDYANLDTSDFAATPLSDVGLMNGALTADVEQKIAVDAADINSSGKTCFMVREDQHDAGDSAPGANTNYGAKLYAYNDPAHAPHLEIGRIPAGGMMMKGTGR